MGSYEGVDTFSDADAGGVSSQMIVDGAVADELDFGPVPGGADSGADEGDGFGGDGFFGEPDAEQLGGAFGEFFGGFAAGEFSDEVLGGFFGGADAEFAEGLADRAGEDVAEDVAAEHFGFVERCRIEQRGDDAGEFAFEPEHRGGVGYGGGKKGQRGGGDAGDGTDGGGPLAGIFDSALGDHFGGRVGILEAKLLGIVATMCRVGDDQIQQFFKIQVEIVHKCPCVQTPF